LGLEKAFKIIDSDHNNKSENKYTTFYAFIFLNLTHEILSATDFNSSDNVYDGHYGIIIALSH